MPQFDVSFLNKGLRKSSSQDYGFLVDQLDIKQSQLESDGKLSPGDYDVLNGMAQKIYGHPGLTEAQRSNIQVKMAGYTKNKTVSTRNDVNDIGKLNREVQDDQRKNVMTFSNDPSKFLETQASVLSVKSGQLSDAIDQIESAGGDATNHYNELNQTLQDYRDTLSALDDVKKYDGSGNTKSDYAAYAVTNSDGQIVDMKIGKIGSQSGYAETNGVYGGLKLYGKINTKDNGQNVFKIGNDTYRGSDFVSIDPATGAVRSSPLLSSKTTGGKNFGATNNTGVNVDLAQVKPQQSIRDGGWIQGEKGFLYQRKPDGSYTKYVNADKTKLGITDGQILHVPRSFESGIIKDVTETVDSTATPALPVPTTVGPGTTTPQANLATTTPAQTASVVAPAASSTPAGQPNTGGAPTARAAQDSGGIAGNIMNSVKGFFGNLFGSGSKQ